MKICFCEQWGQCLLKDFWVMRKYLHLREAACLKVEWFPGSGKRPGSFQAPLMPEVSSAPLAQQGLVLCSPLAL